MSKIRQKSKRKREMTLELGMRRIQNYSQGYRTLRGKEIASAKYKGFYISIPTKLFVFLQH